MENMGTTLASLEEITRLLSRCRSHEAYILNPALKPVNYDGLKAALVRLYSAVLKTLASAIKYFDQSPASKF